jgi:pentatricopeptide repeat protein
VLKAIFKLRKSSNAIGVLEQGVRKRAWDLFAHARFVAHPKASVEMFDTMIYGCSLDDRIGAERALDMFIEMVEMGLQPTYYTYSGLIRTCARAKDPVFYFEALRLLKELLERGFKPQRDIFNSLLEGARPRGDLSRAKWIVSNMVNQSARGGDAAVAPNDATISNLFLTMATFSPAINRFVLNKKKPKDRPQSNVQEAKSKARDPSFRVASLSQETINSLYESDQERILSENGQESLSSQAGAQEGQNVPSTLLQDSVFTSVFPESSEDVLQQGRTILAAILQSKGLDTSILYPPPAANKSQGDPADFDAQQSQEAPAVPISPEVSRILSEIRLTPLLLTSYLALLSAHSNIETTSHCFRTIFPALHVEYTHETWEAMFDKLDRQTGRRIARAAQSRELFSEWWDWLQERYERGNWDMGFVNRHVEMIYTRLINIESRYVYLGSVV